MVYLQVEDINSPRKYTNTLIEYFEKCGVMNDIILDLLNYLSDDMVEDFARQYDILFVEEDEDDDRYEVCE